MKMKTNINRKRLIPNPNKYKGIVHRMPYGKNKNLSFFLCPLFSVFCLLSSALCFLPGCTQQKSSPPEMAALDLSHNVNKTQIMEITEDVLVRMHFEIEKFDPDTGYIKTRPLEGAQFFEFWRSDNVGAHNWLLSNLQSVRRTIEINVDPVLRSTTTKDKKYIDCIVHIQRLSMPEQEVTSSARAYAMFSRSSPGLQTLVLNPEQQRNMAWIDLGRDKELENEITKRIQTKIPSK
jgi:hypothetical protein